MIDEVVIKKLREKYHYIHPLIFYRSVEHAKSGGELFDILYEFPTEFPVIWDDISHRWITTNNPTCEKGTSE